MSQREVFIQEVQTGEQPFAAVCRAYGISPKTGYKWRARYEQEGVAGLRDRSRRPHHAPEQTPAAVEAVIVEARDAHPAWGARKLKAWLLRQGHQDLPAVSTITAILRRYGRLDPDRCAAQRPYTRFEQPHPNALWQMDFKGDWPLPNGHRCYPLTVLDDHSRYLLQLHACANTRTQTVQTALTATLRSYGLPDRMLMDNGTPWGDGAQTPYTTLTVWLLRLGIAVSHGRPYHPQTQGKDERLHRTLNEELLRYTQADSLLAWQAHFDQWRLAYNHQRPHQALGDVTPDSRYQPSPRPFPATLPTLVYPDALSVRHVDASGRFTFQGRIFRLGKAFRHQPIGLAFDPLTDGVLHVFYAQFRVRSFDLREVS
ncbi:MAG: IS481 family transposase [Anaerolineae bacterium]|nr:IS481 family transposase [Anaerolineae bacterium]